MSLSDQSIQSNRPCPELLTIFYFFRVLFNMQVFDYAYKNEVNSQMNNELCHAIQSWILPLGACFTKLRGLKLVLENLKN